MKVSWVLRTSKQGASIGEKMALQMKLLMIWLFCVAEEVTLAMEEILDKEKDYKQLIEVTTFLFERS